MSYAWRATDLKLDTFSVPDLSSFVMYGNSVVAKEPILLNPALRFLAVALHLLTGIFKHWNYLFNVDDVFQVAAPGFHFLDMSPMSRACGWVSVLSALASLFFRRPRYLALVSGLSGLPFLLATTVTRYAFGYMPTLSLIFIGLADVSQSRTPIKIGIIGLYWTAAVQKLLNPVATSKVLTLEFLSMVEAKFLQSFPWIESHLVVGMKYGAVPAEIIVGGLLCYAKTRRLGVYAALVFHGFLTLVSGARPIMLGVALPVLLQLTVLLGFGQRFSWRELLKSFRSKIMLMVGGICIGLVFLETSLNWHPLIFAFARTGMVMFPFVATCLFFLDMKEEEHRQISKPWKWRVATRTALVLVLAWGIYPFLTDYENPQLGYAMFTGNAEGRAIQVLKRGGSPCLSGTPRIHPVIRNLEANGQVYYVSASHFAIEKLQVYLTRNCKELDSRAELAPIRELSTWSLHDEANQSVVLEKEFREYRGDPSKLSPGSVR